MTALHQLIRFVHLVGMAVLLGGAALTWNALRVGADDGLALAVQFEWAFWAAVGVMVVTGVGNLGAVGAPGPATDWGTVLTLKLLVVGGFVLGSAPRTLAVVEFRRRGRHLSGERVDRTRGLRRAYAGTGWSLVAVVALAEVLAHG